MKYLSPKDILTIAISVAMILCLGRLAKSHFDPSWFIVAGAEHVDPAKTLSPVIVHAGPGYDGQFFYRAALHPFDFNNDRYGVNADHASYRAQRVAYPFFAWLLSLCGNPKLVPWSMLFTNILAFAGIFFYTNKFIIAVNGDARQGLLPLLLCGLYMSLSRDLAEVVELFFFTGCIYYLFTSRYAWCIVFATCTLLARETAAIALLPMIACLFFRKAEKDVKAPSMLLLTAPFLIFAAWRFVIYLHTPSITEATAGYGSIGFPFKGIIDGFAENFHFSTTKDVLQLIFWLAYLLWTVYLAVMVCRTISFKTLLVLSNLDILKIIYLVWLLFAICFSDVIYCDDWGFVRIFSLWGMVGFMILIAGKKQTGLLFNSLSAILVLLTIARLVVRV